MTTKKDIVARLRDCDQGLLADCETHVDLITDFSCVEDAAKLIEQLRERNSLLLQQRGCRDEAARRAARCIDRLKIKVGQMTEERDEARRVLKSIVEEFVQHAQTMNPFYPATPMHECEFSWNPECGKCDACEAWGDYVLICHPLWETDEEETL